MPGDVEGSRMCMKQKFALFGIEKPHQNSVCRTFFACERRPRDIEKVTTVRQELRPAVCGLILRGIQGGHGSCHTARGGDPVNWHVHAGGEQDHPVLTPRATARERGIAECQGRTT